MYVYIQPPLCDYYVSAQATNEDIQSEGWAVGPLLIPQANGTMIIDSSSGLKENSFYRVALTVSNQCKTVLKSHSISEYYYLKNANKQLYLLHADTYGIQEVITENVNGSLMVVCVLAASPRTQGCYVILTRDMVAAASAFLLVGEGDMSASHVFRDLHAGSYSVVVYSVKDSMRFEVSGKPVFTTEVNVTGHSSVSSALQHTVTAGE